MVRDRERCGQQERTEKYTSLAYLLYVPTRLIPLAINLLVVTQPEGFRSQKVSYSSAKQGQERRMECHLEWRLPPTRSTWRSIATVGVASYETKVVIPLLGSGMDALCKQMPVPGAITFCDRPSLTTAFMAHCAAISIFLLEGIHTTRTENTADIGKENKKSLQSYVRWYCISATPDQLTRLTESVRRCITLCLYGEVRLTFA